MEYQHQLRQYVNLQDITSTQLLKKNLDYKSRNLGIYLEYTHIVNCKKWLLIHNSEFTTVSHSDSDSSVFESAGMPCQRWGQNRINSVLS